MLNPLKFYLEVNAMSIAKRDKIAGAIYGFAIGDAMGATTEFMSKEEIKIGYGKVTDIIGGGWLNLNPGEVTDDTQMSMCVMDALMKYPLRLGAFENACVENFIKWFQGKPKDVGGQCAKGINALRFGKRISVDTQALGNGSLMRAMPCALVNNLTFNISQGKLTHNNLECGKYIQTYSKLLNCYINGDYIDITTKCLVEPSGHARNTLNNSIYWSQKESFKEALLGAVNDGGDADTIAAITGSLAGAKFGYSKIPKKWINQLNLEVKNNLENFKNFVFSYLQIQ